MEDPHQMDGTDFLCIPPEVIDDCILPHLGWNDLLRLRRVCTWTEEVVYDFMRRHPDMAPELEINQDDKSFAEFLKMGIPTTKIFLNASGEDFYRETGKEQINEFLERYRPLVKHLRFKDFSPIFNGEEMSFFISFLNIESLEEKLKEAKDELEDASTQPREIYNCDFSIKPYSIDVTSSIAKLRLTLGIDHSFLEGDNPPVIEQFEYSKAFWSIEPTISEEDPGFNSEIESIDMDIFHLINKKRFPNGLASGMNYFEGFCATCLQHNVKMYNVGADWFYYWGRWAEFIPHILNPRHGIPVNSLVNLHPGALEREMPNLEKIEIRSTHHSNPGFPRLPNLERPAWPDLKVLEITVDSEMCDFLSNRFQGDKVDSVKVIFDFFFKDVSRPALTELQLCFTDGASPDIVPETEDIVSSCPNLKKLTLIGWLGSNETLTKLWNGLPALEEVSFEECQSLSNEAFVGEDSGCPAFLKVTSLKKISLKGLDKMTKVTDALFSLVIRHMPLTQLTLTSSRPLESVTMSGIRSLLDGKFAESIEKFPFLDWSLANVVPGEWTQLKSEFRSSCML